MVRPTIPSELLLRLMNATPQQYAAVEKILMGAKAETLKSEMLEAEPTVNEGVARNAFALVQRLDADGRQRRPSVLSVFRLYCVDGFSAGEVARKCRCAKGTVINRLRLIEERTGIRAEQFRARSEQFVRMEKEFADSGAKRIYRRGLVQGQEEEDES